jgi:hypothetical protein
MNKWLKNCLWVVFVIIVVCIGFYFILFKSNIGSHPIDHIETLLVGEKDFPPGWKMKYIMPITGPDDWGDDNRIITFTMEPKPGFAEQYVYRFKNIYLSKDALSFLKEELLLNKEHVNPYLTYQSPVANDWFFACDYNNFNGPMCDALGRYEDYIVFFSISADKETLSPEQLEKILETIDNRMRVLFGK